MNEMAVIFYYLLLSCISLVVAIFGAYGCIILYYNKKKRSSTKIVQGENEHYEPEVSVIVPTHNEAPTIENVLKAIPSEINGWKVKPLVIDGASTDDTQALVKRLGFPLIVQSGSGKGAAMIEGFRDLKVWQASVRLVKEIYIATKKFPKDEFYGLTS